MMVGEEFFCQRLIEKELMSVTHEPLELFQEAVNKFRFSSCCVYRPEFFFLVLIFLRDQRLLGWASYKC